VARRRTILLLSVENTQKRVKSPDPGIVALHSSTLTPLAVVPGGSIGPAFQQYGNSWEHALVISMAGAVRRDAPGYGSNQGIGCDARVW